MEDSKLMKPFHGSARFMTFLVGKTRVNPSRVKSDIAEIAQDYAVRVSESDRIALARTRDSCDKRRDLSVVVVYKRGAELPGSI